MQKKGYSSPTIELVQLTTADVLFISITPEPTTPYTPPILTKRASIAEDINGDGLSEEFEYYYE